MKMKNEKKIFQKKKETKISNFFYSLFFYLINNPRMFNGETDDLAIKPYIPHKSLLQ